MRKIWVVAAREYNAAVRTKTFLVSVLIMPLLMGGSIIAQRLLQNFRDVREKRFAVVDRSPGQRWLPAVEGAVAAYDTHIPKDAHDRPTLSPFVIEKIDPPSDPDGVDQLRATLSERVRTGELAGFLEIGPDVGEPAAKPDEDGGHGLRYQTNRPTQLDFARLAETALTQAVQEERGRRDGLKEGQLREILRPVPVVHKGLSKRDPATGRVTDATDAGRFGPVAVPLALMLLMFMIVMMSATPLMQGVVEEKMQRIAEVLLGSVRPFQLMAGKLFGMTGVSLTISGIYLAGLWWAAQQFGFGEYLGGGLLAWFMLFQALAALMFGSLFIAIGAACTDMKETQNLLWPVMLLATLPMFVLGNVLQEPNSPVATGLSFFPFATPTLMIARLAVPPGVPWWQPALGAVLSLLTTLVCVWAAGRIFRVGLLMQGKGARPGEMLRWVFRG